MKTEVAFIAPYKRLNKLIQNETFEPMFAWGVRMAVSAMAPLIWGLSFGRVKDAIWITLTADCLCWVELKGSFVWQVRTLLAGAILGALFSILGSVTGSSVWLSVVLMFAVGFIATILKNIGDRASGLAICVYLLFIFCNAYPVDKYAEVTQRIWLIFLGAGWSMLVGIVVSLFTPEQQPFRRQIALVWRAIANLSVSVSKGWSGNDTRSNIRNIYLKEKEVRTVLDNSFQLYATTANEVSKKEHNFYQLVMLRKVTSVIASHIVAISEELETIKLKDIDNSLKLKFGSLFNAYNEILNRMAMYVVTLNTEEELLVHSNLRRSKKLIGLIKQFPLDEADANARPVRRLTQLFERTTKLIESALARLHDMNKDRPNIQSYSFAKTLLILHPGHIVKNLPLFLHFNSFNVKYALRAAISTALAMFVYKQFQIDHGYWLPFSVLIVMQPYFGATFTKAIERVVGTVLGGIAGSLFLYFPTGLHLKEIIVFLTFVFMVYFLRKKYAIAAFVITLNLVLLFHLEGAFNTRVMIARALCTIGGAGLAVISGFLLLPTWDKRSLPKSLAGTIDCNYKYFIATFYSSKPHAGWIQNKRSVESKNSNVFDSFNRFMSEPTGKQHATAYYDIITYNIRISRDLNNIHIEQDERTDKATATQATDAQQQKINECLFWFNKIEQSVKTLHPQLQGILAEYNPSFRTPFCLTNLQMFYLEKLLIELKSMFDEIEKLLGTEHTGS